jgi:cell wall-associated NlpC family hydrolase
MSTTRSCPDTASASRLLLAMAFASLLLGCSSTPSNQTTQRSVPTLESPHQLKRNNVAMVALSLLDSPYSWGGRGPATGFDCSGLVAHVYKEAAGMSVRGSSAELGRKSKPIDSALLQPGDLVFFNTLGAKHSHVGIYVGDQRFVHASNPRTGVRIDTLNSRYYAQRFEGAATLFD